MSLGQQVKRAALEVWETWTSGDSTKSPPQLMVEATLCQHTLVLNFQRVSIHAMACDDPILAQTN